MASVVCMTLCRKIRRFQRCLPYRCPRRPPLPILGAITAAAHGFIFKSSHLRKVLDVGDNTILPSNWFDLRNYHEVRSSKERAPGGNLVAELV